MRTSAFLLASLACSAALAAERVRVSDNSEEMSVRDSVEAVARAFTAEDVAAYQACFKESRRPSIRRKAALFFASNKCSMEVMEVHVIDAGEDQASAAVKYMIDADGRREVVAEVSFVKEGGRWVVDREVVRSKSEVGSFESSLASDDEPRPPRRDFGPHREIPEPEARWDIMKPEAGRISPNLHHLMGDVGMREGMGCSGGRCANGRCEVR